jgi:protein NrfD
MHNHFWNSEIAVDLFFGGIGVGAFLFAVLLNYFHKDEFKSASRTAAIIAPLSVAVGFVLLLVHLGHPERFYIVFTKVRLTSPLWWGSWLQTIFFVISVLYAWMWLKDRAPARRKLLGYIGAPFALAVGVYHGLLLMAFKSHPLWNTGPTVVTAICGFVMTGIALVVLVLAILPRQKVLLVELRFSRNIMGAAIVVQLFTLALWLASLFFGTAESHAALHRLVGDYGGLFWGAAVGVGLVIPLLLGMLAIVQEKRSRSFDHAIPFVTSLFVLIGGLSLRYVVIMAA